MPGSADDRYRFRLIDPEGLVSEPAHDLGVILRDGNNELLAADTTGMALGHCRHVAELTGVDSRAIWQWAFAERVSTGLFLLRLGRNQEARTYRAISDRLAKVVSWT